LQDIKDILQYYSVQDEVPVFIELKDREKYDIDKIASDFLEKKMDDFAQAEFINNAWKSEVLAWETFFNYDKRNFKREIDLAKNRILYPEDYVRKGIKPTEEKELRSYEKLTMSQLKEVDPIFEKWLRDEVFKKFTDKEGFYFSQESGYKGKNKLLFQVDHIKPMHNGGLTVLENLQILTRGENMVKGIKE
jgi:ATP-dependent helicase IRC3